MRKPKTVTVTRGRLTGTGANKTEAKADLERQIDAMCAAPDPHIEVRFGMLIVVAQVGVTAATRLVYAENLDAHGRVLPFTGYAEGTVQSELIRPRLNAAQNAWSVDLPESADGDFIAKAGVHGDATAASDLRRWINWQRSYNRLIVDGKTPAEAHRLASGY